MNTVLCPRLFAVLLISSLPVAAQTCNPNIPLLKPDSRYSDNSDGTVTDSVTGLMWKQCTEGLSSTTTACDTGAAATYNWREAHERAQSVNALGFAGYNDWRLPNARELKSLVEYACFSPAINLTLLPDVPAGYSRYWTSTVTVTSAGYLAWIVGFSDGGNSLKFKEEIFNVRLVRAGR